MNITRTELDFVELPDLPGQEVRFHAGPGVKVQLVYLLSMWDCSCRLAQWNAIAQRFEDEGGLLNERAIRSWAVLPRPLDFAAWSERIVEAALTCTVSFEHAGWLEPHYELVVQAIRRERGD